MVHAYTRTHTRTHARTGGPAGRKCRGGQRRQASTRPWQAREAPVL